MDLVTIRTEGLGDTSFIFSHEGVAVMIDPQRDVERFIDALEATGADLRFVLETHLHNDYVSGGREIARLTDADLVLPASAAPAYPHIPAFHLEDFDAGTFVLRPVHTPGHTPEHTSYVVIIDDQPVAIFSGGSLLVGSAGRPDLLGTERAETLARLQHLSVNRLAAYPDQVQLLPTHGEGSFCAVSVIGGTTSTIGQEKRTNPVLQYADADEFVKGQLSDLAPYPTYYQYMGPTNLYGPEAMSSEQPPFLTPDEVDALEGVSIIDVRSRDAYAAGHVPGSLGIELGPQAGVWTGWLIDHDSSIVLVADEPAEVVEMVIQLGQIGLDSVVGVLHGLDDWKRSGHPVDSYRNVTADDLAVAIRGEDAPQVLDVRSPSEYQAGSLDGSVSRYVPDLVAGVPETLRKDEPVWVACGSGYRAAVAAGLVERAGYTPVVVSRGGIPDVLVS